MGGDDLGSDDDLYYVGIDSRRRHPLRDEAGSSDDDNDDNDESDDDGGAGRGIKRQRPNEPLSFSSNDRSLISTSAKAASGDAKVVDGGDGHGEDERRLFREAAQVEAQSLQQQASFVTRLCRCHYRSPQDDAADGDEKKKKTEVSFTFLPLHLASYNNNNNNNSRNATSSSKLGADASYLDKLKMCVSAKKLKNWRSSSPKSPSSNVTSPCVIIVCSSARRAVAILKDLAPLKLPVAKLFPKNGSVQQQLASLQQSAKSSPVIAVGTPHRLLQISQQSHSQLVQRTLLVVLDTFASSHGATVGTAADTAPHCAAFVVDHLVPQLQRRNDLKLAFL
jgi:hypothetical protein